MKKRPTVTSEGKKPEEEEHEDEEEEEEEEENPQDEIQEEEQKELAEGFYVIEGIRKKRVHKGQLQYLIKWRDWPENANTWEPIENLQSCSDYIDAFELRHQNTSRKRGRKPRSSNIVNKNKRGSSSDPSTENLNPEEPNSDNGVIGEHEAEGNETIQVNGSPSNGSENNAEKKEGGGCISIQLNHINAFEPRKIGKDSKVSNEDLCRELREFAYAVGLPADHVPSTKELSDYGRFQNTSRKRGRPRSSNNVVNKNRRGSSSNPSTENMNPEEPNSDNGVIGEHEAEGNETAQADGSPSNGAENNAEGKESSGYISIQLNGGLGEEDGLIEDGSLKVECVHPLQGAKKRKSGCVRRFKQDAVQGDNGEKLANEDVASTEDDASERHKLDENGKPPYITKILKPVEYHASVTNNVQQVSIKFKALRSDGQEVLVDDKDLKANNPLVLISYYEQHLRYSPLTCDAMEQPRQIISNLS